MSTHLASGRQRRNKSIRWQVRAIDWLASATITVGGIGTIVSVSLVLVLLLWVVWPLLLPGKLGTAKSSATALGTVSAAQTLALVPDDYRLLAWSLDDAGQLRVFRLDTGEVLSQRALVAGGIQALDVREPQGNVALRQADGALVRGKIGFATKFLDEAKVPAELTALPSGGVAPFEDGLVQRTGEGQLRMHRVEAALKKPDPLGAGKTRLVAHAPRSKRPIVALLGEDGRLTFGTLRILSNLATGKTTVTPQLKPVPLPDHGGQPPWRMLLTERGDSLLLVWRDGYLVRLDAREPANVQVAETLSLLDGDATEITAVAFAPGRETLLVGDNQGHLRAWFRVRNSAAETPDGSWLLPIRELPRHAAAVTSLGASPRGRMMVAGYADGHVQVCDVTTGQALASTTALGGQRVRWTALTPKSPPVVAGTEAAADYMPAAGGVLALGEKELWQAALDPGHPEATLHTLFRPTWFESYERPEHVWQTSAADATAEPKFGLWPLIFGTLKATLYAMLFGAPLALMAAVYTSEFLSRGLRLRIKSVVEMMASLPSVVLGFVAALVIAPVAERVVPVILASLATVPLALLTGACLWQQLPRGTAVRRARLRLPLAAVTLLLGVLAAWLIGPLVERWLFAGNVMLWLDGQQGTGTGGWVIILLPLCGLAAALLVVRFVNPWLVRQSAQWGRARFAALNLLKFAIAAAVTLLLAETLGALLTLSGFDPRGGVLDTYVQRNALIVGFVMGFAIIPIIYTIAEDALSSVSSHLRSASLGCGATIWQTAARIVVPTATSGIFSALMVGLGRAVGETMIVLMAAGNVPLMSWNIFSGFQSLSAGIAVELSEASQGSTHYRILFLAALCLFVLTFIVNTAAELVRIRFRRRGVAL